MRGAACSSRSDCTPSAPRAVLTRRCASAFCSCPLAASSSSVRFVAAVWHRSRSSRARRASASATVTAAPASASALVARSHSARWKTWSSSAFRLMPHSALTSSCSAAAMRSVSRSRSSSSPCRFVAHSCARCRSVRAFASASRRSAADARRAVNSSVGSIGRSGMVCAQFALPLHAEHHQPARLVLHQLRRAGLLHPLRAALRHVLIRASSGRGCPHSTQVNGVRSISAMFSPRTLMSSLALASLCSC